MLGGSGLGAIIGPVLGSFVYAFGGYSFTFYFFAGVLFINLILTICLVPSILNKNKSVKQNLRDSLIEAHN